MAFDNLLDFVIRLLPWVFRGVPFVAVTAVLVLLVWIGLRRGKKHQSIHGNRGMIDEMKKRSR